MSRFAEDYNDVASRLEEFRAKYPEGSLQPVNPGEPVKIKQVGDRTYLEYVAAAYRTPDDPRPGIGVTWEPIPGATQFTRDSEAQNAETSAWGRAVVAALAATTKKGVASANEIENRRQPEESIPVTDSPGVDMNAAAKWIDGFTAEVKKAATVDDLNQKLWPQLKAAQDSRFLNSRQVKDLLNAMGARKKYLEGIAAGVDMQRAPEEAAS